MNNKHLVFVYGSLKKNFSNHWILNSESTTFIGNFNTYPEYTMISLNSFPGVLKNGKHRISGELYEVDDDTLYHLDYLESNGRLYQRELIKLENFNRKVWIYIYLGKNTNNIKGLEYTDAAKVVKWC